MKALCVTLLAMAALSCILRASAVTVTSLNDSGPGSLRAALETGGNIEFAVTGKITLTSGELVVSHSTTITGPGANQLTIARSAAAGTPAFRVLKVQASPVTISGLTISNGLVASNDYNGAGILNEGSLTLNDCTVRGNRSNGSSTRGAGLFNANDATLIANRCLFANNVSDGEGSGIYVFGVVTLNDSTVSGNRGEGYYSRGGGLHVDYFGRAGVSRCTFSSNSVTGLNAQGGGIYNYGRLEIVNSTLTGNYSGETGGGIHADALAPNTAIRNCTISGNTATTGAGFCNFGMPGNSSTRSVKDSIIAGNSPGDIENSGVITSSGYNLFGLVSGNTITPGTGDHFGVTAAALKLAALANNGGPTQTRGLLAGSPATDAGNPTSFPATDQRGVARPFGSRADIGAFELDVILPPLVTVLATRPDTLEAGPTVDPAPGEFTIARSGKTNESLQVFYRLSGTASNGLDYHFLSNSVTIPAGHASTKLRVRGLFDGLVEGMETVVLHLEAPGCLPIYPPPPGCYLIGTPAEAVVKIQDYEHPTNHPPIVQIFIPTNNQSFTAPANIFIAAQANDPDGYLTVQFVEFFAGTNSLGIRTNFPTLDPIGPFKLAWTNVPPGEYRLTARAVDDHGVSTVSEAVQVNVRSHEPPTNQLPTVTIVAPTNGAVFIVPAVIQICADLRDTNGSVNLLEFFAGTNWIGRRTNCPPCPSIQNPFCLLWTNPPPGEYALTVKAFGFPAGELAVSEPVHISVRSEGTNPLSFRLAFNNPNANAGVFFRNYTVNGPAEGNRLLPADRVLAAGGDRYYYGAKPHVVWRVDRDTGAILELDPGPNLPELSWPMGVAFDSHRARVLLTSLGGEGFFYAYSPTSNRWSLVRSQDNLDLDCLEYHPSLDAFFGVRVNFGDGGPGAIHRFNAEGVPQGNIALPTLPFGIGPTGYRSELVSVGDYLVLLLEADLQLDPYGESRMYLIDPRNGNVELTYRHVRPRPDLPPAVQINSPVAGQWFSAPAEIQLVAYAQDPEDGYNLKVEFFAGEHSLGRGTFMPSLCPSPYCPNFALTWSNVPPGQYRLKAVATDSNGTSTVSAPVEITVFDAALSFVTIRATDASASEAGDSGTFTVSREGNTNNALHVFYSISGTASNGVDYVALSNSVFLAEGVQAATIQIAPINDTLFEGTERVELRLLPSPFYLFPYVVGSPSNAVVNITDNEEPPPKPVVTLQATDPTASEAPGNPGQFRLHRTGSTNQSLFVYWAISGTASNSVDYVRLTNTVVIPAGRSAVEIPVTPINDNLFEGNETVVATLYYPIFGPFPPPYTIGSPSNGVVTILDNDSPTNLPPIVRIITPTNGATFTAPASIQICAMASSSNRYVTTVEFFAGDASLGIQTNDCRPPTCVNVWEGSYCLVWSNVPPGQHTLTAKASFNDGPSSVSAPVQINVLPPPPKPVVTLEASDATAWETPGNPGQFRLHRSGPTNLSLSVYLAITGTASNGVDFARVTNLVTLPAGIASLPINIEPIDDTLAEGSETVVATLYFPSNGVVFPYTIGSPSNAVVNIADNDTGEFPVVTIEAPHPTASETPGNPGLFHINRTGPTNQSLTVFWRLSGTASNGVDYLLATNPIVIPAGSSFVRVAVVPINDQLVESNETVTATLVYPLIAGAFPYNIGSPSNATVTILDNDLPSFEPAVVTIEATDPQARESGPLTVIDPGVFTIRRSGNTNPTLHVFCVIEGTASNGVDYLSLSNLVVIPAGATSAKVFVNPLIDNLFEGTETVRMSLQSPACIAIYPPPPECYQVGTPGAATVFIADNHESNALPVVTITASDPIASEGTNCLRWVGWSNPPPANYCGTNTATFVVRRTGNTNASLAVVYEVGGTASNGVDYATLPGHVTIPAGHRAAEIRIVPVDDNSREQYETVVLALTAPPISSNSMLAYTIGTPRRAGAVIVDNDQARPTTGPLPDRGFHLMRPGRNGEWFRIEFSTNFIHWTALCTNSVTDGAIHFVDPDAATSPSRFYRAVMESNQSEETGRPPDSINAQESR